MNRTHENDEVIPLDDEPSGVNGKKLLDAMVPEFQAEFKPDEAEQAGAFKEDALIEADALESSIDLPYPLSKKPAYVVMTTGQLDIPPYITLSRDNGKPLI